MRISAVQSVLAGVALVCAAAVPALPAVATVQDTGMCWVPDWEFPIPCDDIDED